MRPVDHAAGGFYSVRFGYPALRPTVPILVSFRPVAPRATYSDGGCGRCKVRAGRNRERAK